MQRARTASFLIVLLALVGLQLGLAVAAPPEVTGVRFDSKTLLAWDLTTGREGFNVYRGNVSNLGSENYGACYLGSVQGDSSGGFASDTETPAPGTAYFYLVSAWDASGEGTLGTSSSGGVRNPSPRCLPARRFINFTRNGNASDGVTDGREAARNPSALPYRTPRETTGVYLHTGEFFLMTQDLVDRGRSIQDAHSDGSTLMEVFAFLPDALLYRNNEIPGSPGGGTFRVLNRSYRSQVAYDGPVGFGWDLEANARLVPVGADVLYLDGTGRQDRFVRQDSIHFSSPIGIYAVLKQNGDGSFTLRRPDATRLTFHGFDGSNLEVTLERIEDRNGNRITFQYDNQGLLTTMTDTLGRFLSFSYDGSGRITQLTDFAGRSVVYTYDTHGDLVSVRCPLVTGTPNGNDFPSGKTTTYTYSSGFVDARLNHNLLSIRSPAQQPSGLAWLQNSYATTGAAFDLDRLVTQMIGGTNGSGVPAGGTQTFSYLAVNSGGDPNDPALPRRQAVVLDRNGNQREYTCNVRGNLLTKVERTNRGLRPSEGDYTTSWAYNADGEITQVTSPLGNTVLLTYDKPGADRYREGNLLELRLKADPLILGGRGNGHGSDSADRVWTYSYEPVFNQLLSAVEARGNDPAYAPQNGGAASPERYRTSWTYDYQEGNPATNGINALASEFGIALGSTPFNLGDVNGDGDVLQATGNSVKMTAPTVNLETGSNQALIQGDTTQEIETRFRYNSFGQLTLVLDAEGNQHEYQYYPEVDPDGDGMPTPAPPDGRTLDGTTGGYLGTLLLDTASASGRDNGTNPTPALVRYDFAYDDVGNLTDFIDGRGVRTRWVVNQLDQVVETRRAAATADASGPDGDSATARGETGLVAESFKIRLFYDADNNLVRREVEDRGATRGIGPYVETGYVYDLLDNAVQSQQEVTPSTSLATQHRYDANDNLIRVVEPAGNAHEWAYDERDLLLSTKRGASGPRGGAPSTRTLDYDGNGNLTRLTDGRGGLMDSRYDGFDRLVGVVDQVGNTADAFYDPAGSIVRVLARGPVGGPTPSNRSGATNVDLADTRLSYDELSRPIRRDSVLYVPSGVSPARSPILAEGTLTPGDGFINAKREYDRLSRRTFFMADTGATTRLDYDGLSRATKVTSPSAADVTEVTFDANGNAVEIVETETSSTGSSPPPEMFLTTSFYDSLDRLSMVVDNLGQTSRSLYDSLDALKTSTDENGPLSGSVNRRSAGRTGISVPINSHGNVKRFSYDGAGRLLTRTSVLTATGKGDGTTAPSPDPTNPSNPDGLLTATTVWDANSLVAQQLDDNGNGPTYSFDNLDRLVITTADDGTFVQSAYDGEDNETSRTDANGTSVTKGFDPANRVASVSVSPAVGVEGTTSQTFQYDGLSRLTRATDNNVPSDSTDDATATFLYDSLGRIIEQAQQLSDGTPLRTSDVGWLAADLLTDLTYPSGRRIHYSYDAADRLVSLADASGPGSAGYQYFGLSRVHTRTSGIGVRSTRLDDAGLTDVGYDGVARTTLLRHLGTGGGMLAAYQYHYDRATNRASARRLHHVIGAGLARGEIYAYDSANRLISFQEGTLDDSHSLVSSPVDQQTWRLDGVSNWASFTRNGTLYNDTPNNNNEYDEPQSGGTRYDDGVADDFRDLASTPPPDGMNLAHDKNGSQTNIGGFQIHYDFLERPVRALRNSDGLQVGRYAYDALGRRVKRSVTNSGPLDEVRRYHYSDEAARDTHATDSVLEERDAADSVVRQTIVGLGGEKLWQVRSTGGTPLPPEYILEDAAGSAVAVASGGSSVSERVTYDPYGKPTFETPGNAAILDVTGSFIARSTNGSTDLFLGMTYDPELGARTNNVNTDLGGMYLAQVGNDVAPLESPIAWVFEPVTPPDSPLWWVLDDVDPTGSLVLELDVEETPAGQTNGFYSTVYPPGNPLACVFQPVTPPDGPLASVLQPVAPPERRGQARVVISDDPEGSEQPFPPGSSGRTSAVAYHNLSDLGLRGGVEIVPGATAHVAIVLPQQRLDRGANPYNPNQGRYPTRGRTSCPYGLQGSPYLRFGTNPVSVVGDSDPRMSRCKSKDLRKTDEWGGIRLAFKRQASFLD